MSSSSSSSESPIEISEEDPELEISVYIDAERVWRGELNGGMEMGRQNMSGQHPEPVPYALVRTETGLDRLVIASKKERKISRRHVELIVHQGSLLIRNLSKIQPFRCNHNVVDPGDERTFDWLSVVKLEIGDRRIVVGPAHDSGSLRSLANQTKAPGTGLTSTFNVEGILELPELEQASPERIMGWLSETIEVLQSASGSPDFLRAACQAVVDIVKLDHAQVLLREEGAWHSRAFHTHPRNEEPPTPSRIVLRRMISERKTFWLTPNPDMTESLQGISTVIAAPILDSTGLVIGAIYGDRRTAVGTASISDLEARMVEVMAYAVATGLSRQKQEEAAIAARLTAAEQRARLEQFFSPTLAKQLLDRPNLLDGRDVEVTVLFCDLREFAKVSDELASRQLLQWLNAVQDLLSDCVIHNQGVLVDYVGDALLAMWGAPIHQPDHAMLACRAAVSMLKKLPGFDKTWLSTVGQRTEVGIGISTGMALVGNTGSARKFKYGPLGRTVNVGSRVQDATRILNAPILVTESTVLRIASEFQLRKIGKLRLHNLQTPETLYELNPSPDDSWFKLRDAYEAALGSFEDGRYEEAQERLDLLLSQWPEDGPTICLHRRANQAIDASDTFDEVWTLKKYD